jgi:hypothetical protein
LRFLSLFCLATLLLLPLHCCPARHLTQSYFPVLSLAVCPVSCCPSCLLLPVLSPVLSVTPDLFCLRNSIQTYCTIQIQSWLSFSNFREPIIISLSVLAERPVQEVLSCYPVLGVLS